MDKAIEAAARAIAPGRWAVMDSYLDQAKRQYAKSKAAYDPEAFKDSESIEVAKAAMAAAFRNVGFSEDIITAGFGECCGAWDDDQCKEFLPEIFKAMCAAKADELENDHG